MSEDDVTAGVEHFEATMGSLPAPMVTFVREAPEAFEGYIAMRTWLMRDPPAGALDRKIKHLIFCLLDVALGNLEGAVNHARAAVRSGLTIDELTAGVVQVYMTCGVATWGRTGYKVIDTLRGDMEK